MAARGLGGIALTICALLGPMSRASADTSADVTFRLAARSTDRAYMGPHDKASAINADPDIYLVYRIATSGFEMRATGRTMLHRTNLHSKTDTDVSFATLELGPKWGSTSLLAVWEPTYVFKPHTGHELMEQQDVGVKLKHTSIMHSFGGLPVQFSIKFSYANVHPDAFSRVRIVADAQWVTRIGPKTQINWAPEIGLAKYDRFFGKRRSDAIFQLRATPRREFANGMSIGISFMAGLAGSTHSQKSGYDFEVRPELKFRM